MSDARFHKSKWTEPRYETVSQWLANASSPEKKRLVLHGWLDRIEPRATGALPTEKRGVMIYQILHHAASAAAACEAGGSPAMAYLVFHDERTDTSHLDDYSADLCSLRPAIGNIGGFPFFRTSVSIQPTEAFQALAGLKKGYAETGKAVRRALAPDRPPLFDFSEPTIETI